MAQNADTAVADDDKRVTEEDLYNDKYGKDEVETSGDESEEDESDKSSESTEDTEVAGKDEGKTDDQATEEDSEETDKTESVDDESVYVKEFPDIKGDTLEDYTHNLESTIRESSNEGKRLSDENKRLATEAESLRQQLASKGETTDTTKAATTDEIDLSNPVNFYVKQKMDEEINQAYADFSKYYSEVNDPTAYNRFTDTVRALSITIRDTQKRLASPSELYTAAAVILGWKRQDAVTDNDKLQVALKNRAAVSKAPNSAAKKVPKLRVSEAVIAGNMRMFPNKTREDIIQELEPYVQ